MKTLKFEHHSVLFPENIYQINPDKLVSVFNEIELFKKGKITKAKMYFNITLRLLDLDDNPNLKGLFYENMVRISSLTKKLIDSFSKQKINVNPYSEIRIKGVNYVSSSLGFTSFSGGDYLGFRSRLANYTDAPSCSNMAKIISSFYFPKNREDKKSDADLVAHFENLPEALLKFLFVFVRNSVNFLSSEKYMFYGSQIDFTDIFSPASSQDKAAESKDFFYEMLLSVAQNGALGNLEKVKQTSLIEILTFIKKLQSDAVRSKNKMASRRA